MKDRLKKIRINLGFSQNEMAEKLDIEPNTYRGYEYKTKNLPDKILLMLVKVFNVNLNWLFTGRGDMYLSSCYNSLDRQNNYKLVKNLNSFYKRFNKLQKENNLSDFQISKLLDIPESRIEKFGIGKALPVTEELNKIKTYFDVSIDWLLYGETPNTETSSETKPELQNETFSPDEIKYIKQLIQDKIIGNE